MSGLEQALNQLCEESFFAAANLRLLRGNRIEDAISAGDQALREAVKAPILRLPELPAPGTGPAWRAATADSRGPALRNANLGGLITATLDWGSERFGLLELFLASPEQPPPEALAAASVAAQLVTSRVACAQENTFRDFFENAGVGLGIGTADGDVLRVNR
ncbi:MAG TPA: hypothetical protein VH083_05290, partial [Myxococcales bacterium]|nr:hypothetical protein [Myxococcales bacterium]